MEDNSISSSTHKSVASKGTTTTKESPEESGWTAYFEDLSSNNDIHQRKSYSSSYSCGSSLISDAATTAAAARKRSDDNHLVFGCSLAFAGSSKVPTKLRFKKTRTKEIYEDDTLEDTASSPVNSPKVSNFESNDMNPRKREEDQIHSSLVKEITASENYSEIQIEEEEKKKKFDNGMKNKDCRELKKRGMCLVPLSTLANYFG